MVKLMMFCVTKDGHVLAHWHLHTTKIARATATASTDNDNCDNIVVHV